MNETNKPIEDGGPAFPVPVVEYNGGHYPMSGDPQYLAHGGGMTLRDYFAAKALTGIVDRVLFDQHFEDVFTKDCATDDQRRERAGELDGFCAMLAYGVADKMLAERSKGQP